MKVYYTEVADQYTEISKSRTRIRESVAFMLAKEKGSPSELLDFKMECT